MGSEDRVLFAGGQLWDTQAGRKAALGEQRRSRDAIFLHRTRQGSTPGREASGVLGMNRRTCWEGEAPQGLIRTASFFLLQASQSL